MCILAAGLIDAENISPKWASDLRKILDREINRGTVSLVSQILVGNTQAQKAWKKVAPDSSFVNKIHTGGRGAADWLLHQEALKLVRQGIVLLYIVSNDGDFETVAQDLHLRGCQVVGLGTSVAAMRFQQECDIFLQLGTGLDKIEEQLVAFHHQHRTGGLRRSDPEVVFSQHDRVQEAFHAIYGSATLPPLLSAALFALLERTLTALCLTDADPDGRFSKLGGAEDAAQTLTTGVSDPIIHFILEQDATLKTYWEAVAAFAYRCHDAFEQGRTAAHRAFSHFPHVHFHALHQEHLEHLLVTWCYNPYAASSEAQHVYPDYRPEMEHSVLRRWFRRGYLAGSLDVEDSPSSTSRPRHRS